MNRTTIVVICTELYAVKDINPGDKFDSWHIYLGNFLVFWCYRNEDDRHLCLTDLGEQVVEYIPVGKWFVDIGEVLEFIKVEMENK